MSAIPVQTCPICKRTWQPSPFDDCMVPSCNCFGAFEAAIHGGAAPCEKCGINHAMQCAKMPDPRKPLPPGAIVKVIEIDGPLGTVARPAIVIEEEK